MKPNTILLIAVLAFAHLLAPAQITNWAVEAGGNGHCYEAVLVPGAITWSNASLIASNRGGYLATITSSAENAFVFGLTSQHTNCWYHDPSGSHYWYGPWLGGIQPPGSSEPAGGWQWVTGEPFTYSNWAPRQPNNNGGAEDRIQFGGQSTIASTWNDQDNLDSTYARSFIIEYSGPLLAIAIRVSQVEVCWDSRTNWFYQVQYRSELATNAWTDLGGPIQGNGSTNCIYDAIVPGQPQRFYRVVTSP